MLKLNCSRLLKVIPSRYWYERRVVSGTFFLAWKYDYMPLTNDLMNNIFMVRVCVCGCACVTVRRKHIKMPISPSDKRSGISLCNPLIWQAEITTHIDGFRWRFNMTRLKGFEQKTFPPKYAENQNLWEIIYTFFIESCGLMYPRFINQALFDAEVAL